VRITDQQIEAVLDGIDREGQRLVEEQPTVRKEWKLKDDGTFLTRLDSEIQRSLEVHLAAIFPECHFIGEEDDRSSVPPDGDPKARIFLDPIDGTGPYIRGLNFFAISLAIVDSSGQPLLGVIHLPAMQRWWVAKCEGGVSTSFEVSYGEGVPRLRPLGQVTSFCAQWDERMSYVYLGSDAHRVLNLTRYEGKCRALGATAAHLALLLDGTIDPAAVVLTRYRPWDVAAGLVLSHAYGLQIRALGSGQELVSSIIRPGPLRSSNLAHP
jgi:fructose-1,6-bisphosphatase/inositol monophosphatase family enzyme